MILMGPSQRSIFYDSVKIVLPFPGTDPKHHSKAWAGAEMQIKTTSGLLLRQRKQTLHTTAPSSDIVSRTFVPQIFYCSYLLWSAAEYLPYPLSLHMHS